jgi:hypothetical protein
MVSIFISYRRVDSSFAIDRIYDELCRTYGKENVFKDVDSILLGENFRETISASINSSDIFLPIIGKNWNPSVDGAEGGRIYLPDDYVRIEIEAALKKDIPIIPIIIDGGKIPKINELPDSIKILSLKNGWLVRPDPDFNRDINKLKKDINNLLSKKNKYNKFFFGFVKILLVCSILFGCYYYANKTFHTMKCNYNISLLHTEFDQLLNYHESNEGGVRFSYRNEELKTRLPKLLNGFLLIKDNCLSENYKIEKYELWVFTYVLSASTYAKEYSQNKEDHFKKDALNAALYAIKTGKELEAMLDKVSIDPIKLSDKKDLLLYNLATAYAIQKALGIDVGSAVKDSLDSVSSVYIQRHPLKSDTFLRKYEETLHAR